MKLLKFIQRYIKVKSLRLIFEFELKEVLLKLKGLK